MRPVLNLLFPANQVDIAGFECIALTLIVACGFWLRREIQSQQQLGQSFDVRWPLPRVHAFTAVAGMPFYFLFRSVIAIG